MANLIVCCFPGDEITIFGNAILAQKDAHWKALLVCPDPLTGQSYEQARDTWHASCLELGVEPSESLNLPSLPTKQYDWAELSRRIQPFLKSYERVYVPDLEDVSLVRRMVTFSAARHLESVWMESGCGVGDEVGAVDGPQLNGLIGIANHHYPLRLRGKTLGPPGLSGDPAIPFLERKYRAPVRAPVAVHEHAGHCGRRPLGPGKFALRARAAPAGTNRTSETGLG